MNGSTVLTIGTALNRAEQAGAQVSALVQGQWICGRVVGIDGHGVVLANDAGESAILRLEHVAAVRIDQEVADPSSDPPMPRARQEDDRVFHMGAIDVVDHPDFEREAVMSGSGLAITAHVD